jgi:NAD-dependent dihydropyrimidine dehydrogenase PreA subunit
MRINGKDGLACKTLVKEVVEKDGDTVTVEPLRYLPVLRDLIVDQSDFFEKYRSVKPFLINDEPVVEKERIQSQEERLQFDDTTNCILCASCYSACPVLDENTPFSDRPPSPRPTAFWPTRGIAGLRRVFRYSIIRWRVALPEPFQMHPVLSAGHPDYQTDQPDQTHAREAQAGQGRCVKISNPV